MPGSDKPCGIETIQCEYGCGLWVPRSCTSMSKEKFGEYAKSSNYFLCPKGVADESDLDFVKCLER